MIFHNPTFIFGDYYISKNKVIEIQNKYKDKGIRSVTYSASTTSLDEIRGDFSTYPFDDSKKIIIIEDIPNKKNVREFLINIASSKSKYNTLVIWDSNNHIKIDPNTKALTQTWNAFVRKFKKIPGSTVINNGSPLIAKNADAGSEFVKKEFAKYNKNISSSNAKLLISIVGNDRGLLSSDIKKISLVSPKEVRNDFILTHAYPSSKDAILYELSNALDSGSYEDSMASMESLLNAGMHYFVLCDLIVKKARWQLMASHMYYCGFKLGDITSSIMDAGQVPSYIWHNNQIDDKKFQSAKYQKTDGVKDFFLSKRWLRDRHFNLKNKKDISSERIPFRFQADAIVNFLKCKIIDPNNIPEQDKKVKVFNRAINTYLLVLERMSYVRYGTNQMQYMTEMIKAMTDTRIL